MENQALNQARHTLRKGHVRGLNPVQGSWPLARCLRAARARLRVLDGCESAATWEVALFGAGDGEATAWQGVSGAAGFRSRWVEVRPDIEAILK